MEKGYIHVYTGNGKGKTTAAVGLAVRAACFGKKIYFGQFVKGMKYNEVKCENYFNNIKFEQLGRTCFINRLPEQKDIDAAVDGLKHIEAILLSKEYDVVVMDELTIALYFKLLKIEDVLNVIKNKPYETELIITGRYAPEELLNIADLITEMKEIKHYYYDGILSRNGIDR